MATFRKPMHKIRNITKAEPVKPFPTEDQLAEMVEPLTDGQAAVLLSALTQSFVNQTDGFTTADGEHLCIPHVQWFAIANGVKGLDLGADLRTILLELQLEGYLIRTRTGSYIPSYFSKSGPVKTIKQTDTATSVQTLLGKLRGTVGKTAKSA